MPNLGAPKQEQKKRNRFIVPILWVLTLLAAALISFGILMLGAEEGNKPIPALVMTDAQALATGIFNEAQTYNAEHGEHPAEPPLPAGYYFTNTAQVGDRTVESTTTIIEVTVDENGNVTESIVEPVIETEPAPPVDHGKATRSDYKYYVMYSEFRGEVRVCVRDVSAMDGFAPYEFAISTSNPNGTHGGGSTCANAESTRSMWFVSDN